MNLLRCTARSFGNRFRRLPKFYFVNIFREYEQIRYLRQMDHKNYYRLRTGSPGIGYSKLLIKDRKALQFERAQNFEHEVLNFLEKYDSEISPEMELYRGKFSEVGTFRKLEKTISQLEPNYSTEDQDFVAELSKFCNHIIMIIYEKHSD